MSGTVIVSSCKGAVYVVMPLADFAWLWRDVLDLALDPDNPVTVAPSTVPASQVLAACARVLREIQRGRGGEFAADYREESGRRVALVDQPRHLTRRLVELGAIATEAAGGPVSWR